MTDPILKYQQTDEKLRAIEVELSKSDERIKLATAKKFLDSAPEKLDKTDARAAELIALLESFDRQYKEITENLKYIEVGENDLDSANYNKKSAEKLQEKLRVLKQSFELVTAEMNQLSESFSKLRNQTILMQRQYKEYRQKYAELKAEKEKDSELIIKELEEISKKVPTDIMTKYKQKRADKVFPILYEVNGKKCGQCGMELSLSDLSKLSQEKIIECENCRRMIYTKE